VALDPLRVTNGVSLPGVVSGTIAFTNSAGFSGLNDVPASSAYRGAVEYAVSHRLMDGSSNGSFRPNDALTRAELAQYLVMGAGVRQSLPAAGKVSFTGLSTKDPSYAAAEAVVAKGAVLRDLSQTQAGVMGLVNGNFKPADKVTKLQLAYSLVQSLGLQDTAVNFNGTLSVTYNGKQLPIEDVGSIPASLRGYVQSALDNGILNARYTVTQDATDLQPTLHAYFDPTSLVTRGAYAVTAGRFLDVNRQAED
jgi:serine protease AprX